MRRKEPGTAFVTVPVLLTMVSCPVCGSDMEFWAGDDEAACGRCGYRIIQVCRLVH